jgi:hypothetical protein
MLEIRPNCECCDKDLPNGAADAMICTFECTFCKNCIDTILHGICPNCGGDFQKRAARPAAKLIKNPVSAKRVFNPDLMKKLA